MRIRNTLIAVALATLPTFAMAVPIETDVTFSGTFVPVGSTSLDAVTGLDFTPNAAPNLYINDAVGELSGFKYSTQTINDFMFSVSNDVSGRSKSTPPSNSPRTCSA